jgi:D-glycero-D-manno-heptose 1,7-bisphosphate phosphatase
MSAETRRAVFLDRDGTVIADHGYLRDPEQVELLPGAAAALATFADDGFLLIVVSNQSGIGRGWISPAEARAVDRRFVEALRRDGVSLDGVYYCPHAPQDGCACRKPRPGLLLQAAHEHTIDPERSIMIGNAASDMGAGKAAGAFTILLADGATAEPQTEADASAADWGEVRDIMLTQIRA